MTQTYTTPTVSYGWPTGDRLTSRLKIPRGLCVITNGSGGWNAVEFPYLGDLIDLTEGTDYFLGGHVYQVSDAVYDSLTQTPTAPSGPPITDSFGYGVGGYGIEGYGL